MNYTIGGMGPPDIHYLIKSLSGEHVLASVYKYFQSFLT